MNDHIEQHDAPRSDKHGAISPCFPRDFEDER